MATARLEPQPQDQAATTEPAKKSPGESDSLRRVVGAARVLKVWPRVTHAVVAVGTGVGN